jgi:hypothetical protein
MNPLYIYIALLFTFCTNSKNWFYSHVPIMHVEIWFKLDIRPTLVHTWYLNWYKVGITSGPNKAGTIQSWYCLWSYELDRVLATKCMLNTILDIRNMQWCRWSKTMLNTTQQTVPKLLRSLARLLNNRLDPQLITVLFLLLVKQRWEIEPGHACAHRVFTGPTQCSTTGGSCPVHFVESMGLVAFPSVFRVGVA